MGKLFERLRQVADDFLRLAGLWALAGATVTTFVVSAVIAIWAYLGGVRGVWLAFAGGMVVGTFIVLLLTVLLWLKHRARLRKEIFSRMATSGRRGFLTQKKQQRLAAAELMKLFNRMTTDLGVFTVGVNRVTAVIQAIPRWFPDGARDVVGEMAANYVARRMDRMAGRRVLLNTALDDSSSRFVEGGRLFLTFAVNNNTNPTELESLRTATATFQAGSKMAKDSQVRLKDILLHGDVATDELIASSDRLGGIVDQSVSLIDRLDIHAQWVLALIDEKLGRS